MRPFRIHFVTFWLAMKKLGIRHIGRFERMIFANIPKKFIYLLSSKVT